MSPCALQRDGADSAQGLRRPRGWRESAWNWGLSTGGTAPGRSPTGSPAADGPWPGGDRVSVRHEGSEGTTRGDPTGAGPCGRDSGRDAGVRAELAACGCCGQAGWAGRSVTPGLCPDIPHAGTGSGRWTGWDVRGGAGGGLARPQERDSGAAAVPALQDPCHGGFTTGSCHTGTAPAGRAGWHWGGMVVAAGLRHGPADPALAPAGWCSLTHPGALACGAEPSLPLPSHGRRSDFAPNRGLDLGARSPARCVAH